MTIRNYLLGAALAASALTIVAQDGPGDRPDGRGPRGGFGGGPLMEALDTNKDGELSAEEISGAAAALAKLDKNGDGTLSRDEIRPARPGRPGGPDANRPRGERPPRDAQE